VTAPQPKRIGRPPLPAADKLIPVPVRLTPAQRDKLQRIGPQRLRDWLDRVKVEEHKETRHE
jgi:hypothetical protein